MTRLSILLLGISLVVRGEPDDSRWGKMTDEVQMQMDQGRYAAALPLAEAALNEAGSPLELALSLNKLLYLHLMLGSLDDAERFGRRAVTASTKLEADRYTNGAIWTNMGHLYNATSRFPEAERSFRKALELLESAPGVEADRLANIRNGLGLTLLGQNRLEEAEQIFTRSLQEAGAAKADNVLFVATVALGELYVRKHRFTEAEQLFLEALAIRERIPGRDHPFLAEPLYRLARIRFTQRRYAEADSLCKRAMAVLENVSPNHPQWLYLADLYAKILRAQKRKTEAKEWAKRAKSLEDAQSMWQRHTVSVDALLGR